VEISIASVKSIRVSPIAEYDLDEDEREDGDDPFYRTLTIETESGTLKIDLDGVSREALEVVEVESDDEGEDGEDD
jgi:hypothetical protein